MLANSIMMLLYIYFLLMLVLIHFILVWNHL